MAPVMRMAELSAQSGVPVATIKLYLREGILQAGTRTSPNQALYEDAHVRRLRLIRALREVGDLPLATIKQIVSALDQEQRPLHKTLGMVQQAITPQSTESDLPADTEAIVDAIITERDWPAHNPGRKLVIGAITRLAEVGADLPRYRELLSAYADAADIAARADIAGVAGQLDSDTIVEQAVSWTVLGDAVLSGFRRIAQESHSARVFGSGEHFGSKS